MCSSSAELEQVCALVLVCVCVCVRVRVRVCVCCERKREREGASARERERKRERERENVCECKNIWTFEPLGSSILHKRVAETRCVRMCSLTNVFSNTLGSSILHKRVAATKTSATDITGLMHSRKSTSAKPVQRELWFVNEFAPARAHIFVAHILVALMSLSVVFRCMLPMHVLMCACVCARARAHSNCQLQRLGIRVSLPTPYTPHRKPYTRNSTPWTLHPAP